MAATQFWGIPEVLTVSASPAPTTTVFTVSSATNLLEGQWILIQVNSAFERGQILDITGSVVTLASALTDTPDTPGEVRNGRVLILNSTLNAGGLFNADAASDLEGMDMTYAPAGIKYLIPDAGDGTPCGIYRWIPDGSDLIDGDEVLENAGGVWKREGAAGTALEDAIFDWHLTYYGDLPAGILARLEALEP